MAKGISPLSDDARILEAVLFLENNAIDIQRIKELTGLDEESSAKAIKELREHYQDRSSGLALSEDDGAYSFVPVTELYPRLRQSYGRKVDKRLSRSALETLSIIAYSQPITRKEIEEIRGVASDTIVRLLREREYIKVVGRKDVQGHPCLYGTSRKFLYEFKLKSISDLPKLSEIDRMRFEKEEEIDNAR
ncbi:MAG: SMC-Scp complex subunit ScpB [Candidatus Ornithospirochaeta sp.]|nr:SMC-Scp complex subunit ScpB [Candidatus Ornithospirochaeta sp.]